MLLDLLIHIELKIIIFAGGTGKRFWPVSRANSPKQFLPVGGDKPLLRMRYELLRLGFEDRDIFISTGNHYSKEVKAMLPELPEENFIFEPEMRDTGPAVTLAVAYVTDKYPDEAISIQWSDHIIKKPEVFIKSLKKAEALVKKENKVVFITVPARFPSPHRGYINYGDLLEELDEDIKLNQFKKFVEKPNEETAKEYIASGQYGWNPGYWVIKGQLYLDVVKKYKPEYYEVCNEIIQSNFSEESLEKFKNLEKNSADYIFAENVQAEEALVSLTDMGWSDVGEWIALKEALEDSKESNVISGNVVDMGSKDSIIFNYDDSKIVSTIGLEGFVVVNTKDAVAIFKKEDNTKLKEYLKLLESEGKDNYL